MVQADLLAEQRRFAPESSLDEASIVQFMAADECFQRVRATFVDL